MTAGVIGWGPDLFFWTRLDPRLPSAPYLLKSSAGQDSGLGKKHCPTFQAQRLPQGPVPPHLLLCLGLNMEVVHVRGALQALP